MSQFGQKLSSKMLLVLLGLEVVVRTNFLYQPVVCARECDEDAYNLEGFGTDPCSLGLGVFWVAGLARVVHAGLGFLGPVGSLVLDPTVEFTHHHHVLLLFLLVGKGSARGLWRVLELGHHIWNQDWVFGVSALSCRVKNAPSYSFGRRDNADRYVSQTGWVMTEVDTERAVDVVHDFPRHQEAELHRLHIKVKITPAQNLLCLWGCFSRRFGFGRLAVQILIQGLGEVLRPPVWTERAISRCFVFGGDYL